MAESLISLTYLCVLKSPWIFSS